MDSYLTLWIFIAIELGVEIGYFLPSSANFIDINRFGTLHCHGFGMEDLAEGSSEYGTGLVALKQRISGVWL